MTWHRGEEDATNCLAAQEVWMDRVFVLKAELGINTWQDFFARGGELRLEPWLASCQCLDVTKRG